MKQKLIPVLLSGLLLVKYVVAAEAPGTDISLYKLSLKSDQRLSAKFVRHLVQREGYDNQPFFTADSNTVLYTSQRQDKTDIWQVSTTNGMPWPVTNTESSQYSPTDVSTLLNQRNLLSAIVATQGKQSLELFKDGESVDTLNGEVEPIGYHAWINQTMIAVFQLAQPNRLVLLNRQEKTSRQLADDIGRCMISQQNGDSFYYVQNSPDSRSIVSYSLSSDTHQKVVTLLADSEDFAWQKDIGFVHSDGKQLFWLNKQKQWQTVAVEGGLTITNITRLSISPNGEYLAVVHKDIEDHKL